VIQVHVANNAGFHPDLEDRWASAIEQVLRRHGIAEAEMSLAIVDDPTIHELNRRFLSHDRPTDVLTFRLDDGEGGLEGEIVISAETAIRQAKSVGWSPTWEALLYIVHGVLHLVGFDDTSDEAAELMRREEHRCLEMLGVSLPSTGGVGAAMVERV